MTVFRLTILSRGLRGLLPSPRRTTVELPDRGETLPRPLPDRVVHLEEMVAHCAYRLRFEYDPLRETDAVLRLRRMLAGAIAAMGRNASRE